MKKWLMADLHIHSTFSDRSEAVEEMTKIYGKVDLDLAVTTNFFFNEVGQGLSFLGLSSTERWK